MKEKILVVEDDISILTGLVDLLTGEAYQVSSARDGEKALALFKTEKPDLILLDIMIPQKSGYEVCQEIRKMSSTVPIVMLTAKGQEVDKVVGLEIGADDYIVKPFGVNELLARLRRSCADGKVVTHAQRMMPLSASVKSASIRRRSPEAKTKKRFPSQCGRSICCNILPNTRER